MIKMSKNDQWGKATKRVGNSDETKFLSWILELFRVWLQSVTISSDNSGQEQEQHKLTDDLWDQSSRLFAYNTVQIKRMEGKGLTAVWTGCCVISPSSIPLLSREWSTNESQNKVHNNMFVTAAAMWTGAKQVLLFFCFWMPIINGICL